MPTVSGFTTPINMGDPVNFGALAYSVGIGPNSSTSFTTQNSQSGGRWVFGGTGFSGFSQNIPNNGTVTSIAYSQNNIPTLNVTGVSLPMSTFFTYLANDNMDGLLNFIFAGDDSISGSTGFDNLFGFGGNDTINGSAGGDAMRGGDGNDIIHAGNDFDFLYGDDGNDTLNGNGGSDQMDGGAGTDTLNGGDGFDIMDGGLGDDTLNGGGDGDYLTSNAGVDTIDGGDGIDTLFFNHSSMTGANVINLTAMGTNSGVTFADGSTVRNVERMIMVLGSGADTVTLDGELTIAVGPIGPNTIDGGAGVDRITADFSGSALQINSFLTWTNFEEVRIRGGSMADTIQGGSGDDIIYGNGGDDVIYSGGGGVDFLDGGDGIDTVQLNFGNSNANLTFTATGGAGVTFQNFESFFITTGSGNDTLTITPATQGDNVFLCWDGVDTLIADFSAASSPLISTDSLSWQLTWGGGRLNSFADAYQLTGTSGDDILWGAVINNYVGNDILIGNAGNDTLRGFRGNDQMSGGEGNDIIYLDSGVDQIDGGAGTDVLAIFVAYEDYGTPFNFNMADYAGMSTNTGITLASGTTVRNMEGFNVEGSWANDTFTIGTGIGAGSRFRGNGGSDRLIGNFGAETATVEFSIGQWIRIGGATVVTISDVYQTTFTSGSGNDTLIGGNGDDFLYGGAGNDTMYGGYRDDLLDGGDGDDILYGHSEANTLLGGAGNDRVYSSDSRDHADGGDGIDWVSVIRNSGVMNATFVAGGVSTFSDGTSVQNFESFEIGATPFVNDTLTVTGQLSGDSTFYAGTFNDHDRLILNFASLTTSFSNASGTFIGAGWTLTAIGVDEYQIFAGSGADTLIGTPNADILVGNGGADNLNGREGGDFLTGGAGNDIINGWTGWDTANYAVASTSATWTISGNTVTLNAGAEGTDTVTAVEVIHFTDRNLYLNQPLNTFFGDASSDILLRRSSDGVTAIWSMNGATVTASAPTLWQAGTEWSLQGFGDFNSDGTDDFLLRRNSDGVTAVWSMQGTNVIASDVTQWQAGNEWQIQAVGDFNADGYNDILWRRTDGVTAIWNMNGTSVVNADVTLWQAGNEWQIQGVGDFNGDGRDDFLWRRVSDGVLSIWNMDGANVLSADVTNQQAGLEWAIAGIGDFNGDGRDDLLLRRGSDGTLAMWQMNGTTVIDAGVTTQQAGAAWHVAAIGDYDGDGLADILLQNSDSLLAVWQMSGRFVVGSGLTTLQAGFDWEIVPGG